MSENVKMRMKAPAIDPSTGEKGSLIEWALSILLRERDAALYGNVTFYYEAGKITRIKTEKCERPIKNN